MATRHSVQATGVTMFFLLVAATIGGLPQGGLAAQELKGRYGVDADGKPEFFSPEQLETLLAKQGDETVLPELSKETKERAVSSISFLMNSFERSRLEGRLNDRGCSTSLGIYHKPLFILDGDEEQLSFRELVERAEIAVVAEVISARSGLVSGSGGTLVHLRAIENVKNRGVLPFEEIYYKSLEYDFKVNGQVICRLRDHFYHEQAGDVVLLIARSGASPRTVLPYGVFEVVGGVVMPQPYEFLLPMEETRIDDLLAN